MNLLKLLKSLPAKYAAKRMAGQEATALLKVDDRRFQRFCMAVSMNPKSNLAQHKKELGRLLELLPGDLSIMLMEAIEKSHPGLVKQISLERSMVLSRIDHIEKTEFVAMLFLSDRVSRCAETARRIMGVK